MIATRPERAATCLGKPLKLFANYFSINFLDQIKGFNKYVVKTEPEVPDNSAQLLKTIVRAVSDQLKTKLPFYICSGRTLISHVQESDIPEMNARIEE